MSNRWNVRRLVGLAFCPAAGVERVNRWSFGRGKGKGIFRELRIAAVNGIIRERASYDGVARNTSTKAVHIEEFPLWTQFEMGIIRKDLRVKGMWGV